MRSEKFYRHFIAAIMVVCLMFSFVGCTEKPSEGDSVESIDMVATLALNVGEESTLQVALTPFGVEAEISWRSSDPSVATVSDGGVVKGIAAGTAMIRATAGGKSANCTVTVTDASQATVKVTGVAFNTGVLQLEVGKTGKLTATVSPENATDKSLVWKSSKEAVATVANDGTVTAVAAGSTVVTATSANGVKATCVVKVAGETEEETVPLYVKKVGSLADRTDFIMGMDASAVPSLEAAGVVYKNFDGEVDDVYAILKDNGITDIRIRIWNDPYQSGHSGETEYSYGGGNCDVDNAVAIAERCEAVGLGVIIDFHYSDFWADPGKQKAPKAWSSMSASDRETAIYEFTKDSLTEIKATGVKITMVQIGNETTRAICEATYSGAPDTYCAYINAGSRAVREVTGAVADGGAKVAIHLTNPESRDYVGYARTFASKNVDYDVFGSSYYPYWHGTLANLATKLRNVHEVSNKEVMVLETSYAFTYEDFDGTGNTQLPVTTEPLTVQGQSNAILNVIETIADLGDYGLGVCYWEGTWIAPADNREDTIAKCNEFGCGWASAMSGPESIGGDGYQASDVTTAGGVVIDNQAFFMSDGTALESLKVFKLAKDGQQADPLADYLYDEEAYYTVDVGTITLPEKVTIVLNDGSIMSVDALWDIESSVVAEYIHTVGDYVIEGTTAYGGSVKCKLYVQNKNLLVDGGFEDTDGYPPTDNKIDVPEPWEVERLVSKNVIQLYVSNVADNAEMGSNSFHFWDDVALEFNLYQQVDLAAAVAEYGYGTYGFSIDFSGGDCGETQEIYAYALVKYKDGSEDKKTLGNNVTADGWKIWSRTAVDKIVIDENVESVAVGIYVKAEAGGWGNIDNAQFFFKSAE